MPVQLNCGWCGFISLRTATLLIGSLNLVGCVFLFIGGIVPMTIRIFSDLFIAGVVMLVVSLIATVVSACLIHGARTVRFV